MSICPAGIARPFWFYLPPALLLLAAPLVPAAAQVEISVQGGIHAARLARPERAVIDPGDGIAIEGARGEASTFGLRLGKWLSNRWGIDGGFALSTNRSWQGSVSIPTGLGIASDFQTQTIFSSATLKARITAPNSRFGLVVGAGPALIFHRGSGSSLLTRNTDLGGLVDVGGSMRLSSRLAFTLDVQQYLFSSRFAQPYAGQFVGDPIQPAGSQFRHEVVILAGVAWRTN
jgi:hypothetical protein